MSSLLREWNCNYCSVTESGDYLQVLFEEEEEGEGRYILIQSQCEFPQDYDIKIEADGGEWCSELLVNTATLDKQHLVIDGRDDDGFVRIRIRHAADDKTYVELKHVLKMMLPSFVAK